MKMLLTSLQTNKNASTAEESPPPITEKNDLENAIWKDDYLCNSIWIKNSKQKIEKSTRFNFKIWKHKKTVFNLT